MKVQIFRIVEAQSRRDAGVAVNAARTKHDFRWNIERHDNLVALRVVRNSIHVDPILLSRGAPFPPEDCPTVLHGIHQRELIINRVCMRDMKVGEEFTSHS